MIKLHDPIQLLLENIQKTFSVQVCSSKNQLPLDFQKFCGAAASFFLKCHPSQFHACENEGDAVIPLRQHHIVHVKDTYSRHHKSSFYVHFQRFSLCAPRVKKVGCSESPCQRLMRDTIVG
jgi:hypothetical protein